MSEEENSQENTSSWASKKKLKSRVLMGESEGSS